jgi:error-prone DNA polymerase
VVERIHASRPSHSLTDFGHRARVSRPVVERLVLTGAFDRLYDIAADPTPGETGRTTRRDLLLQVMELDRYARSLDRATRGRGLGSRRRTTPPRTEPVSRAAARNSTDPLDREAAPPTERHALAEAGVWARASAQSRATPPAEAVESVQLTLDLGDRPGEGEISGLPEMNAEERLRAELEILGLDVSSHVVDRYTEFLDELGVTRSSDLLQRRSKADLLVAGVKVATQTPPVRSGRRVVFLTLDDATGPVDATFFEDAQGPYAATVFGSWLLVVRGELRRTGYRGVSLRATGAWELPALHDLWQREGMVAVHAAIATVPAGFTPPGQQRTLVHSSGFQMSPYADIRPAGAAVKGPVPEAARKLRHRSPGSPG